MADSMTMLSQSSHEITVKCKSGETVQYPHYIPTSDLKKKLEKLEHNPLSIPEFFFSLREGSQCTATIPAIPAFPTKFKSSHFNSTPSRGGGGNSLSV